MKVSDISSGSWKYQEALVLLLPLVRDANGSGYATVANVRRWLAKMTSTGFKIVRRLYRVSTVGRAVSKSQFERVSLQIGNSLVVKMPLLTCLKVSLDIRWSSYPGNMIFVADTSFHKT